MTAASADDAESLPPATPARPPVPPDGRRGLRVAVLYNLKESAPSLNGRRPKDALAELDSWENVQDYLTAIRGLGHEVAAFEGQLDLPARLAAFQPDLCFNTCEGFRGDSREAQVPALLEMMGLPYSAGRVLSLAVTLDKAMTKRVLAYHGVPTPHFQEFGHPDQPLDPRLRFPLFVKPNRQGSGIGIHTDSVVHTPVQLHERVAQRLATYRETVLVEEYVEGRDVTCGLVGNLGPTGGTDDLHLFPISEIDYSGYAPGTEHFYSYKLKVDLADDYHYFCPAPLPEALAAEVRRLTVETFRVCGCLDVGRVDFRLDVHNNLQPMVLEINALPGLSSISDLTLCARAEGWTHDQLLQAVLNAAVDRHGLPRDRRGVPDPNYERLVAAPLRARLPVDHGRAAA